MINVSCAVIRNEYLEVLVVQRGEKTDHPFKWEFPGGKVERGENYEDAVIREVEEELGISIIIVDELNTVEYDYGHKQIRLFPFVCDTLNIKPELREHIDFRWVAPSVLCEVDFSEADITVASLYNSFCSDAGVTLQRIASKDDTLVVPEEAVSDDELKSMVLKMTGSSEVGWIAASAASNQLLFRKLLDFTEANDDRVVFRSSWALTKVCEKEPGLFTEVLPEIVNKLLTTGNGSALRSFLKILSLTGTSLLDEKQLGLLVDYCFTLLRSRSSAIAVKIYSIDVLYEISGRYPGLSHELAGILNMLPDDVPAGIKAKSRALIRKLTTA